MLSVLFELNFSTQSIQHSSRFSPLKMTVCSATKPKFFALITRPRTTPKRPSFVLAFPMHNSLLEPVVCISSKARFKVFQFSSPFTYLLFQQTEHKLFYGSLCRSSKISVLTHEMINSGYVTPW